MFQTTQNRKYFSYLIVLLMGVLFSYAYFYFKDKYSSNTDDSSQTIQNEIKKLSKLIVVEGNYSDVYRFSSQDQYLGNLIHFDKKILVVVNAKVQIVYDMKKLKLAIDSTRKIININYIPDAETQIIPEVKYYDIEQSTFNQFSAEDLNKVREQAIKRISNMAEKSDLKNQGHQRLMEEFTNLITLSKAKGWTIEDNTNSLQLDLHLKE